MRELSIGLSQDFAGRVVVVREPVVLVRILVAVKETVGLALVDAMTFAKRFVVAFDRIGLHQRRAVSLNAHLPFFAGVAGHDNLHRHLHHGAEHRVGDARIPGTGVEHHLTFADLPAIKASSNMRRTGRSFRLPPGLAYSALA